MRRDGDYLQRLRRNYYVAAGRLRYNLWAILQTALAASLAYLLALFIPSDTQPFFAPIAAVITLGVTLGQRGRRAFEVAFGVAVGLLVADVIVLVIGVGALQIGIVVALAMAAVIMFSTRTLLVNQAAISAILVVVLTPPQEGFNPDRVLHALVGGGVALTINYLFPADPEKEVQRVARPILDELAAVLEEIADALRKGDAESAADTLERAREVDDRVRGLDETLSAGYETAWLSPTRRRALKHLELYFSARVRLELAAINTRVLARGASNAIRRGDRVPFEIPAAVVDLAKAAQYLPSFLEAQEEGRDEIRTHALEAAREATAALQEQHDLGTSILVGQIRSAAVDLLRSTGMDQAASLQALEDAAGKASDVG